MLFFSLLSGMTMSDSLEVETILPFWVFSKFFLDYHSPWFSPRMSTRSRNQACFEQCDAFMTAQIVKMWDQYEVISRMNNYVSIWFPGLKKRWENKKPGEERGEPGLDSDLGPNLDPLIRYVVPKNSECPSSDRFRLPRWRGLTFFFLILMKIVEHTWELN